MDRLVSEGDEGCVREKEDAFPKDERRIGLGRP